MCNLFKKTTFIETGRATRSWEEGEMERCSQRVKTSRYADDTTVMAESKEELKSLLMRVKEESEKTGLKLSIKKLRSWRMVPSLHGK